MTLSQNIIKNYGTRVNKDSLYNSTYSILADEEKQKKITELLNKCLQIDAHTTILEIGAGQGSNLPMLLNLGFNHETIFVNELLPERIAALKSNYPNITIFEGDALQLNFNQQFDVVFQSTVFTSILNDEDREILANKMWDLLKPGGIILWYDFIYNNPNNPDVKKVDIKEVKKLFSKAYKSSLIRITLAPPIGRRVGRLYNFFNFPIFRSHILVLFQKMV